MDELTLDGNIFVSTKRAAKITGYAKDYIGQLCREGRVAARLVGRNWYVLESSIKVHRFGEETIEAHSKKFEQADTEAENSEDTVNTSKVEDLQSEINELSSEAWYPSRYTPEPAPEPLPTTSEIAQNKENIEENEPQIAIAAPILPEEEKVPKINLVDGRFQAKENIPLSSKVVNDMQEAWQDWFIRTNEFKISKETLLEDHYDGNEPVLSILSATQATAIPQDSTHTEEDKETTLEESEVTPIKLEKILDSKTSSQISIDQESENVPIRRTKTNPMPVRSHIYPSNAQISRYAEAKEGRVLREREILRKKKPNHAIQVILMLIALVAVGVTFIGSGIGGEYVGAKISSLKPVQFLVGESTVNK